VSSIEPPVPKPTDPVPAYLNGARGMRSDDELGDRPRAPVLDMLGRARPSQRPLWYPPNSVRESGSYDGARAWLKRTSRDLSGIG